MTMHRSSSPRLCRPIGAMSLRLGSSKSQSEKLSANLTRRLRLLDQMPFDGPSLVAFLLRAGGRPAPLNNAGGITRHEPLKSFARRPESS